MANMASNVSVGKPQAAGGIWLAPAGSTLPVDATTALNAAFASAGYISEKGLFNDASIKSKDVQDWSGDTVLTVITSYSETFAFTFIETNPTTLKARFGDSNVTIDKSTGLAIVTHQKPSSTGLIYVFEIALTGDRVKRIVVPNATISDVDKVTYDSGDAIGYGVTLTANPSELINGGTAREFITKVGPVGK